MLHRPHTTPQNLRQALQCLRWLRVVLPPRLPLLVLLRLLLQQVWPSLWAKRGQKRMVVAYPLRSFVSVITVPCLEA